MLYNTIYGLNIDILRINFSLFYFQSCDYQKKKKNLRSWKHIYIKVVCVFVCEYSLFIWFHVQHIWSQYIGYFNTTSLKSLAFSPPVSSTLLMFLNRSVILEAKCMMQIIQKLDKMNQFSQYILIAVTGIQIMRK